MGKHHRQADWLHSAQLVACLGNTAVSVIFALLRKTLLVTVSFQFIFGRYLFLVKDAYQMKTVRKRFFYVNHCFSVI